MHELDALDFRIHIAGPPYVVEMLRRNLAHDFRYFSLTAVVLFGLTMAALFRSIRLFLGMLCTCVCRWTSFRHRPQMSASALQSTR